MAALVSPFKHKWVTPPQPVVQEQTGKVVIITGATSGIGLEAAYKFAALGASKVIIAARDLGKGETTKTALEHRLGRKGQLEVWELDMLSYESVVAFAKRANQLEQLDIVILNAGVRRTSYHVSGHGWEEDLQVNTLSTTLLAILLLPQLKAMKQRTGKAPILEFVNSGLHQNAVVPSAAREEPNVLAYYNNPDVFKEGNQYSYSKVFLMYGANQLASEISSEDVIVTSVCPGWVFTDLGRDHYFPGIAVVFSIFIFLFMRSPAQGANILVSGTTQGESVHGRFWQHDMIQPMARSVSGVEMKDLSTRVWRELIAALKEGAPYAAGAIDEALAPNMN